MIKKYGSSFDFIQWDDRRINCEKAEVAQVGNTLLTYTYGDIVEVTKFIRPYDNEKMQQ